MNVNTMTSCHVPLADGTTREVAPGGVLPWDLHPDFTFFTIPGDSVPAARDANILIRTRVAERDQNVAWQQIQRPDDSAVVVAAAGRSIRNAMPAHDRTYASMLRGERRGIKKWQGLVEDFCIVLTDRLVRGETLRVLVSAPELDEDGLGLSTPIFLMRRQDSPRPP